MSVGSSANLTIQTIVKKERSKFNIPSYQIDVANLATWLTGWGTLKTASAAICAGVIRHEKVLIYDTALDANIPTDGFARRELKLLLRYQGDTSGEIYRSEFPCPDLDVLTFESGDANYVVMADAGVMAAFISAWEAIARSPEDESETVTILDIHVVGRNL